MLDLLARFIAVTGALVVVAGGLALAVFLAGLALDYAWRKVRDAHGLARILWLVRADRGGRLARAGLVSPVEADDEAIFLPAGASRTFRAEVDAVVLPKARYYALRDAEERSR